MKQQIYLMALLLTASLLHGQGAAMDPVLQSKVSGIEAKSAIGNISEDQLKFLIEEDTTIRVDYIKKRVDPKPPAFFVNGVFAENLALTSMEPTTIEEIKVEKLEFRIGSQIYSGKINIKLNDNFGFKPITIASLLGKHLELPQRNAVVVMINNQIISGNYSAITVNERSIYRIEVQQVESENLKLTVINLITRNEKNIRDSESIRIRGENEE